MKPGGDLSESLAESMSEAPSATFNESYPAVAASIPAARHAIRAFAEAAGAAQELLEAVTLASSEALTNVVLHAYREALGSIEVTTAVAGNELWVLVADGGGGMHSGGHSSGLGVGLAVIALQCDEFAIVDRACGGTEVRMRFHLRHGSGANDPRPLDVARTRLHGAERNYQSRGSVDSAMAPALSIFSTTT